MKQLITFLNKRLNLTKLYLLKRSIYQFIIIHLLVQLEVLPPLVFDRILSYADDALYWVEVRRVTGVEYQENAQLLRIFLDVLGPMDG